MRTRERAMPRLRWTGWLLLAGACCLLLAALVPLALAQTRVDYDLSWWTMDAGAHVIDGGEYVLMGTTGQPDAGPVLSDGEYALQGGFWPGAVESIYQVYLPYVVRNP